MKMNSKTFYFYNKHSSKMSSGYSSQHFVNAVTFWDLPISTRVDYGFDENFYQFAEKPIPTKENMESLFKFYKNMMNNSNWEPLHFYEYLRDGHLREVLNENGFEWVSLSTELH